MFPALILFHGILRPFKGYAAVGAYHVRLPRRPDNRAAFRADIFDTAVLGFFAPAFGGAFHRQAAGVDFILAQYFSDPCLRLRGQRRYCSSVFVVLLNGQAMGLSDGFEFQVVVFFHGGQH